MDVLIDIVDYIDARTSCYLLERLAKYWYDYPDKKGDVDSWYPLIRKLIRKIVFYDSDIGNNFLLMHPDLAVCERPATILMRNQKKQALAWKKLYLPNVRLVQDSFYFLGYNSIIDLCEKAGGFNITRKPDIKEQKLLMILENSARKIFFDFFTVFPNCMIIENDSSVYNGTADLIINKKKIYNSNGYLLRYTLTQIAIKKSSFSKEKFTEAFSTYCHELCHCFGGDASAVFSHALTDVINHIMKNIESLQYFQNLWMEHFDY